MTIVPSWILTEKVYATPMLGGALVKRLSDPSQIVELSWSADSRLMVNGADVDLGEDCQSYLNLMDEIAGYASTADWYPTEPCPEEIADAAQLSRIESSACDR